MKSYFIIILLSICFMAAAQSDPTGPTTRQQLETFDWFKAEYDAYKVHGKTVKALKEVDKTADYRIVIVLGTWCSDSRREVPRFYKIVDALGFPQANILTILVDENKNDVSGLAKQFTIKAQKVSPKNSNTRSCVIVKIYFGQTHPCFFLKTLVTVRQL